MHNPHGVSCPEPREEYAWDRGLPEVGYWRVCQIWVAKGSLSSGPDVRSAHFVRTVDGIEKLSL